MSTLSSTMWRMGIAHRLPASIDIFTPANTITVCGLVLTLVGAFRLNTSTGLCIAIVGRFMDMLDGPVARHTHTSHFGGILDAASDKSAGFALLIAAYHFKLAPILFIVYVFGCHLVITILNLWSEKQGKEVNVTIVGKLTMFLHISSLLLFIWSSLATGDIHTLLHLVAIALALVSVLFAIKAVSVYWQINQLSTSKRDK